MQPQSTAPTPTGPLSYCRTTLPRQVAPDHTNAFKPFEGLLEHHEDRLTRAALLVMKLVPLAREAFLRLAHPSTDDQRGESVLALPGLSGVRTQTPATLRELGPRPSGATTGSKRLTSVFLTPDHHRVLSIEEVHERVGHRARVDGLLQFGDELVVVVESKLDEDVPDTQACYLDIDDEEVGETRTSHVSWHKLLEAWLQLSEAELLSPAERGLLDDFWVFVEGELRYENLLPFTTLSKAGDNHHRRLRRLRGVLSEAADVDAARTGDRVDIDLSQCQPPPRTASIAALYIGDEVTGEKLSLSLWPGFRTGEARCRTRYPLPAGRLRCAPLSGMPSARMRVGARRRSPRATTPTAPTWRPPIGRTLLRRSGKRAAGLPSDLGRRHSRRWRGDAATRSRRTAWPGG